MVERAKCVLIQEAPAGSPKAPLFLFHDGGGTIFHYFLLDSLDRNVYGIANPRGRPGQDWEGGLHQMAEEYLAAIREVASNEPVLLGGWSLGGLTALEMSHIIARQQERKPKVKGLVLIDSVFPHPTHLDPKVKGVRFDVTFESHVKPEVRKSVLHCREQTHKIIGQWQPPKWNGSSPPPAILLRAKENAPRPKQMPGIDCIVDIDVTRHRRYLGWEDYEPQLIKQVLDSDGHHHNIFDFKNLSSLDEQLGVACNVLDGGP